MSRPPTTQITLPNGDKLTIVRKDIMDAALRPKRKPLAQPGDKIRAHHPFAAGVKTGVVQRRNGGYVYVAVKVGRVTFSAELYDNEIAEIISSGNPVPITDRERELAAKRVVKRRALAMKLAEVYHGRPVDEDYVFGEATGGAMFGAMAEAALELLDQ
jgi:hypothetical protein